MWRRRGNVTMPPNKLAEDGALKLSKLALQLKQGEAAEGGRRRADMGMTAVIVIVIFTTIGVVVRPPFVAVVAVVAVKSAIVMFCVVAGAAAATPATTVVGGRAVPIRLHV